MYKRETTIKNKTGLHARPASDFVLKAKTFEADIKIRNIEKEDGVSAKSLIRILAEGFCQSTKIEISGNGVDEKEAVDSLVELVQSGFGE